eukprot:1995582-Prymnesium_polylepis.1
MAVSWLEMASRIANSWGTAVFVYVPRRIPQNAPLGIYSVGKSRRGFANNCRVWCMHSGST